MVPVENISNQFLKDMNPELANHYLHWLPFCRQAVHDTTELIGNDTFLHNLYGDSLTVNFYQDLKNVWFKPYTSYLQRSGKLFRPYIICFCMDAFNKNPETQKFIVALAEIIHTASLVFDDIADDSSLRRGEITAHQQVGVRVAGAAASAWLNVPFELLHRSQIELSDRILIKLTNEIAWEHWVTGLGSTIDAAWVWMKQYHYLPQQYLQSVVHRSTSYTYRLPFKIGALAAGANDEQFELFSELGESLGLAFQIIDDILNIKPTDKHWGKEIAEDITQGKITLQVLLALEECNSAQFGRLTELLQMKTTDPTLLAEAIYIMEQTGAFYKARKIAEYHIHETQKIIEKMTFLPARFSNKLFQFINYILNRGR
jgi:geranylgeranyl pyrophosphate synthase